MKKVKLIGWLLFSLVSYSWAQSDYLVKTASQKVAVGTEEEVFVDTNFPLYQLCGWKPGMKFMFVGEVKQSFIAVFKSYETNRDISNARLQHRIFEYVGAEETGKETHVGVNYSTRFVFESDNEKFYHEFKGKRLDEICLNDLKAYINCLVFLGDVDVAKEKLVGTTLYSQVTSVRVDDPNSGIGYRNVTIKPNQQVKVTDVGVGSREYPVKIVFETEEGNSYYKELAFSATNSGMAKTSFTGERLFSYFPNAFSFEDRSAKRVEEVKAKYVGSPAYPRRNLEARKSGALTTLIRYTPLVITDLENKGGTRVLLSLAGRSGEVYVVDTDMKYDVFIKNDDFIDDIFGFTDLRADYPTITEENWALISAGEVRIGMTKDECRLALGSAVQIVTNLNSKYETWYYLGKTLDFDGSTLMRIK